MGVGYFVLSSIGMVLIIIGAWLCFVAIEEARFFFRVHAPRDAIIVFFLEIIFGVVMLFVGVWITAWSTAHALNSL